jgi:hypothetical protein
MSDVFDRLRALPGIAILVFVTLPACSSVYYGALEEVGVHKRDILVKRVVQAKDSQEAVKDQFANALEEFQSVVQTDGGDLETKYNKLNTAYERSVSKAKAVKSRNDDVERVADALFREWNSELDEYSNANLRASSARQLSETQARYKQLLQAMRRAESRLEPVLKTFHDQVLYLKHNLNARAIGSLKSELQNVEANTAALIRDMNASIAEAERFVASME